MFALSQFILVELKDNSTARPPLFVVKLFLKSTIKGCFDQKEMLEKNYCPQERRTEFNINIVKFFLIYWKGTTSEDEYELFLFKKYEDAAFL